MAAIIPTSGWHLQPALENASTPTAVIFSIPKEKLEDLKSSTGLHLVTGKNPSIRYGTRSIDLSLTPERFSNELYLHKDDNLTYYANAAYRAKISQAEQDDALFALQQSFAQIQDEKKASQIHVESTIQPEPKNRFEAAKQAKKGGVLGITRQLASPSLNASRSPAPAPTSAYHDTTSPKTKAVRHAVVHLLAMRALSTEDIAAKIRLPAQEVKSMLQTMAQMVDGKWKLPDKAYKELDVWRFKYPTEDNRKTAIDNAIKAYDRLRLSKDDKLWQLLLPKAERGKGKVLSRLHLGLGAVPRVASPLPDGHTSSAVNSPRPASQGTPNPGAKKSAVIDRLLSKDPKRARAAEEAKDKKRKERQAENEERPNKKQATGKVSAAKSAEFVYSSDEEALSKSNTSDHKPTTQAKSNSTTKSSQSSQSSKPLPKTAATGKNTPTLNGTSKSKPHISPPKALRPTVPSPLGAVRPRVASDVSDRSGISQRREEQARGLGITSIPRKRHDTVTSADSEGPNKTVKDLQSQKSRLTDSQHSMTNGHYKTASTSSSQSHFGFDGSSDSSTSLIETITFNQGVDLAADFQDHYYPRYAKLYDSIVERQDRGETVSSDETKQLWDMHRRLAEMKREIEAASERQRGGES